MGQAKGGRAAKAWRAAWCAPAGPTDPIGGAGANLWSLSDLDLLLPHAQKISPNSNGIQMACLPNKLAGRANAGFALLRNQMPVIILDTDGEWR